MIFHRFYDEDLAQASFLIACSQTNKALIVDPRRDFQIYLEYARQKGLSICAVAETHIHADYLSGARELCAAVGATLVVSAEGGKDWQYRGLESFELRRLQDGERFAVGEVHLEAMHTPGHTPEHLTFAVYDDETDEKALLLTGDFLFVGSLGRPDLLETTGNKRDSRKESAAELFDAIKRFADRVPHDLPVWPGHGAGSACGKSMSQIPATTLGFELRHREWARFVEKNDRKGFVEHILDAQPDTPSYFGRMKVLNRDGFPLRRVLRRPPRLTRSYFPRAREQGAIAVDLRSLERFEKGHLKGSIHLPLEKKLATWAAWVFPEPRSLVLVVDEAEQADRATEILLRIGQDDIVGFATFEEVQSQRDLTALNSVDVEHAQAIWERKNAAHFIDVRSTQEFEKGYIPGARHFPITNFTDVIDDIPDDRPLITYCGSGARAAVAASFLKQRGFDEVSYFDGSMGAWRKKNLPEETP